MKSLLLICSLLLSISIISAETKIPTINLDSKDLTIEKLTQGHESSSHAKFYIKRSEATPSKVTIKYTFDEYYSYCVETDSERYWVEGDWEGEERCFTNRLGQRICEDNSVYVPGHYEYREYCVSYDYSSRVEDNGLRLDFKKAAKLSESQEELFLVEMKQKGFTSSKFTIDISAVKTEKEYEIKRSKKLFKKAKYKFKVKSETK